MKKVFILLCVFCTITQVYAWKPQFAGHRGSYRGVENTEEAFLNGINHYGYTGLEIDVKTTSDGICVCWHDDDLSRVGHNIAIASTKWEDLKDLPLTQTRGGVTYTGKLCTVDRYLEICKTYNIFPIIELKWASGINNNDMSWFPKLYALIQKYDMVDKAYILTSMQKSLEYVRTNYPALKCQYLCYEVTEAHYEWCKTWGINPSVQTGGLSKYMARKCHDAGMEVACWTVNSLANYQQHGELGCTTMTCDYLIPADMPELEEVDWDELYPITNVDSLSLSPTQITIAIGDTATFQLTITPPDAEYDKLLWRYNPTNRNSVLKTNGTTAKFTSKKVGTYTITATIAYLQAECSVTVSETTNITEIESTNEQTNKFIRDGQLYIKHNNNTYSILGVAK